MAESVPERWSDNRLQTSCQQRKKVNKKRLTTKKQQVKCNHHSHLVHKK